MMTAVMMKATTMTADRVEQRGLDLALDGEDLFLVGREALEQGIQDPACSPAATRLQYRASKYSGYLRNACDSELPVSTSALMSSSSLATARVGVAAPDDVERLEQRHAGFHHRRELAREQGDVLLGNLAAHLEARLLDARVHHALAAQAGLNDGLARRAHFAANRLAIPVLSFPDDK
jgi:hypothetical protein